MTLREQDHQRMAAALAAARIHGTVAAACHACAPGRARQVGAKMLKRLRSWNPTFDAALDEALASAKAIDLSRRARFLRVLAATGSMVEASRRASPACTGLRAGQSYFHRHQRRDPAFAAAWAAALETFHSRKAIAV